MHGVARGLNVVASGHRWLHLASELWCFT
jgi:hypothetical protein